MSQENSKPNCVVGLCVRNNEIGLPKTFDNLMAIRSLFNEFTVIAFYNKSIDRSLEILKNESRLEVIIIDDEDTKTDSRTMNIARARNGILGWIRANKPDVEYFIMMDSNSYSCQGDIRPEILGKYLTDKYTKDWDSLSFARIPYYDLWAYSDNVIQLGCWTYPTRVMRYVRSGITAYMYQAVMNQHIDNTIFNKKSKNELVAVDSAFCGFAIYKTKVFVNHEYLGYLDPSLFDENKLVQNLRRFPPLQPDGRPVNIQGKLMDCEHRAFHLAAKKYSNARIMVAKDQLFGPFRQPDS